MLQPEGTPVTDIMVTVANNKAMLEKAYRLIYDNVPTVVQMVEDPRSEVFQKPLNHA